MIQKYYPLKNKEKSSIYNPTGKRNNFTMQSFSDRVAEMTLKQKYKHVKKEINNIISRTTDVLMDKNLNAISREIVDTDIRQCISDILLFIESNHMKEFPQKLRKNDEQIKTECDSYVEKFETVLFFGDFTKDNYKDIKTKPSYLQDLMKLVQKQLKTHIDDSLKNIVDICDQKLRDIDTMDKINVEKDTITDINTICINKYFYQNIDNDFEYDKDNLYHEKYFNNYHIIKPDNLINYHTIETVNLINYFDPIEQMKFGHAGNNKNRYRDHIKAPESLNMFNIKYKLFEGYLKAQADEKYIHELLREFLVIKRFTFNAKSRTQGSTESYNILLLPVLKLFLSCLENQIYIKKESQISIDEKDAQAKAEEVKTYSGKINYIENYQDENKVFYYFYKDINIFGYNGGFMKENIVIVADQKYSMKQLLDFYYSTRRNYQNNFNLIDYKWDPDNQQALMRNAPINGAPIQTNQISNHDNTGVKFFDINSDSSGSIQHNNYVNSLVYKGVLNQSKIQFMNNFTFNKDILDINPDNFINLKLLHPNLLFFTFGNNIGLYGTNKGGQAYSSTTELQLLYPINFDLENEFCVNDQYVSNKYFMSLKKQFEAYCNLWRVPFVKYSKSTVGDIRYDIKGSIIDVECPVEPNEKGNLRHLYIIINGARYKTDIQYTSNNDIIISKTKSDKTINMYGILEGKIKKWNIDPVQYNNNATEEFNFNNFSINCINDKYYITYKCKKQYDLSQLIISELNSKLIRNMCQSAVSFMRECRGDVNNDGSRDIVDKKVLDKKGNSTYKTVYEMQNNKLVTKQIEVTEPQVFMSYDDIFGLQIDYTIPVLFQYAFYNKYINKKKLIY